MPFRKGICLIARQIDLWVTTANSLNYDHQTKESDKENQMEMPKLRFSVSPNVNIKKDYSNGEKHISSQKENCGTWGCFNVLFSFMLWSHSQYCNCFLTQLHVKCVLRNAL